eukprot:1001618-Prymnesium_polylepis.1
MDPCIVACQHARPGAPRGGMPSHTGGTWDRQTGISRRKAKGSRHTAHSVVQKTLRRGPR